MKHFIKCSILILAVVMFFSKNTFADTDTGEKILVIGVDGIITTAIDYATTSGIDDLLENATYNMNSYGGLPAYSSTGWATILTGVSSSKHGVKTNNSFSGNNFDTYPSIVTKIKSSSSGTVIASIVRDAYINSELNYNADYQYNYSSDAEVAEKAVELVKQDDVDIAFVQFSSPEEVGVINGYQLRDADYIIALQEIDGYVKELEEAIQSRTDYENESWSVYFVSTHGGTESGTITNNSKDELEVPAIFSGSDFDNKELDASSLDPISGADNTLTINKASSGDFTYVRIPIDGTELQGMNKFTIEMWIKPGDDNESDPSIMGDKDWDSGGNPGFTICRSSEKWKINIANQARTRYDIKGDYIEDGNWHHIAVTFNKTKEIIVYQDGELISESTLDYVSTDDMSSPYDYLCLAQEGTESYGGGSPNWSGTYNEVRIWTAVLSQETLQEYMNQRDIEDSDHPDLESLALYLKMDEIKGTTVKDYSGNGHNGELIGTAIERNPLYSLCLTDVATNILNQLEISADGLDGNVLKANVPYRLFKVN